MADNKLDKINWSLIVQRENARIEWKENAADERDVVKTLCAFANDIQQVGGGRVICGLREKKNEYGEPGVNVVGLDAVRFKELKNKVPGICHRHVEPPLTPEIEEYPVAGDPTRKILIFSVTASKYAHRYRIKNEGVHYYVRVNDRTQPADGLMSRLLEQKEQWPSYLDQTHPEATLKAFDQFALKEFLEGLALPLPVEAYLEPGTQLRGDVFSLVTHPPGSSEVPVPRNFAILVFGKEPHRYFRGAYAILSIYQGLDKTAERSQRFEIFGPIPGMFRNIMTKLQLHLGMEIDKSADMTGGNQNRPRFSERAIAEALANAFVHRDYHSQEPVRITVFSDRIEVTNPGGLYNGIRLEQLQKGENIPPSWRNPSLIWFMVILDIAQNEGQGIRTIIKKTREISGKSPIFEVTSNWFNLIIPAFVPIDLPSAVNSPPPGGSRRDGLIMVSIGGDSIEKQVEESLERLGLTGTKIAVNFISEKYVEGSEWEETAKKLKESLREVVDSPEYERFHLFYRGPVIFAPLVGALIAPTRRLLIYQYDNGRYIYTHTIDKKFLKEKFLKG
jgi:ATP-dependent DNA helicase RecG